MEQGHILSILYEMALAIGGEVSVKPLLAKMLQRLLYHTSFPAGFVCLGEPFPEADAAGMIEVRVDTAVGDYELAGLVGQKVRLPAKLLLGKAELSEDAAMLAALPEKVSRYTGYLRLPIEGQGVIVLLAPQLPDTDLPLTQLFQPLMANLAKAIVLCRSHDAYTGGLIAARDASQQALASSEEKFSAISAAVLDALIMVDDSSVLVYWNPAAERILGYRANEALGKPLHQLLTPQRYQSSAIRGFNSFRTTGLGAVIGKTIEIEALHKDGHEIPVELSISALKLNGHWHAVGILRDITEKKRMEEELRQANVYNRSLIEASLDPLVTISAEGKITDANQATEKVTGRNRLELIGTDFSDYFTEPDRARDGYLQVFAKGFVTDYPLALRHRDGHVTDVLYNASVYRSEAGEVLGVFAAARDITEHKLAEETRTRLAAIVESSNDAIVGKTLDGIITSWNKGAERVYGYSADEIIGQPITTLAPPSRHAEVYELLKKVRKGEIVTNHESERIRKDGTRFYVSLTLSPIRDTSGNITGISTIARDISERKQAEEALFEAQQIFRTLVESSPDIITRYDRDCRRTYVNPTYLKVAQIPQQELLGSAPVQRSPLPEPGAAALQKLLRKVLDSGMVEAVDVVWPMADDIDHWYNICAFPEFDREGQVVSVMTVSRDITERKLAEEALHESEAKYHRIVDTATEGIWVLGPDTMTTFVNARMAEMLGYSCEEMNGMAVTDFLLQEDVTDHLKKMESRRQNMTERYERRFRRKDGEIIWTSVSASPILNDEHRFVGSFAMVTDITERKRTADALKKSEERLRLEVARMPIGYIIWDNDFRVVSWNHAAEKIFGFTFDEAKGQHPYEIIVPPEAQPQIDEIWRRLLAGDESAHSVNENRTKDGSTIICEWTNTPLKQPDGTILGVMSMVQDITEKKQAEEEIRALNRDLEQRVAARTADLEAANKELEAFSYSVSHDLRTPLRAIDGFSHILLEDYAGKLDDEGKRLLKVVRDNTSRMGQLIDDILKFSRAGRVEIAFSEIDMEKLAHEALNELQPAIAGDKLRIDIGHIPSASGDHAMMHQVFINLLSNAIKFSRQREPAIVQVGAAIGKDETIYYVKDNGAGFDMQYADKLFGVFQRLHSVSEFEGTGIGLAIVKRIVSRHGGRVWAEGKVNEGATIYFALPAKAAAQG